VGPNENEREQKEHLWSGRMAISLIAIFWSGATFVGVAQSFMGVLIPRFFVGLGEAGFVPGGTAMISAAYPKVSILLFPSEQRPASCWEGSYHFLLSIFSDRGSR